jgi:membrane-associated phospholipid phosphatase
MTALSLAAYVTYELTPAAPPWMASDLGELGPVTRVIGHVWEALGVDRIAAIFHGGNSLANDVGAIPSLHSAYPIVTMCLLWKYVAPKWRVLLVGYPLAMATALVYSGEHYVADVLLGWLYAALVVLIAWAITGRTARV